MSCRRGQLTGVLSATKPCVESCRWAVGSCVLSGYNALCDSKDENSWQTVVPSATKPCVESCRWAVLAEVPIAVVRGSGSRCDAQGLTQLEKINKKPVAWFLTRVDTERSWHTFVSVRVPGGRNKRYERLIDWLIDCFKSNKQVSKKTNKAHSHSIIMTYIIHSSKHSISQLDRTVHMFDINASYEATDGQTLIQENDGNRYPNLIWKCRVALAEI